MTDEIPADTGSADPGTELRLAAKTVQERYRKGSAAYGFWRVIAGIWERWADRTEKGIELSAVAHAEFQAALFSARKYLELRHGGWESVTTIGPPTCTRCGHLFASDSEPVLAATELAARLLGHVCSEDSSAGNVAAG